MERPLHYVLISPVILSLMVESGRQNGEKICAVQYLTPPPPPPPGMLQPEPNLSGLNTATIQLPWTLTRKKICLLLVIWPNLCPPFKTRSIAME